MFNQDYREILKLFIDHGVDFMIVGAYAMAAHGVVRATGDIDIFVRPDSRNADAIYKALAELGAPLRGIGPGDFSDEGTIYEIGVAPCRIDIINQIDAVPFEDAGKVYIDIDGLEVPFIDMVSLRRNKSATGRAKDSADVELLDGP